VIAHSYIAQPTPAKRGAGSYVLRPEKQVGRAVIDRLPPGEFERYPQIDEAREYIKTSAVAAATNEY